MTTPRARLALLPMQRASAVVLVVGGVLTLAVSVAVQPDSWVSAVAGVVGAAATLLVLLVVLRLRLRRWVAGVYAACPVADASTRRTTRAAVGAGVAVGLAAIAAAAVLLALDAWLVGTESVACPAGAVVLAFGVFQGLQMRELERWQDMHGLEVCTREGSRVVAWTNAQARARLVVVPLPAGPR